MKPTKEDMERAIAWANNSLFGSHACFLSTTGGPPDEHHLDTAIERLKAGNRKQYSQEKELAFTKEQLVTTQNDLRTCYISLKRIAENPHACTCVREFSWYGEGHNDGCPVAQALFALTPEQRRMVRAAKKILGD